MVIAADSAGVADAIGPSPSGASLRGLDGVTCFSLELCRASALTSPHFYPSEIGPNRASVLC